MSEGEFEKENPNLGAVCSKKLLEIISACTYTVFSTSRILGTAFICKRKKIFHLISQKAHKEVLHVEKSLFTVLFSTEKMIIIMMLIKIITIKTKNIYCSTSEFKKKKSSYPPNYQSVKKIRKTEENI